MPPPQLRFPIFWRGWYAAALNLSTLEFYKINHVLCGGGKPPPYLNAEQIFSTNQILIYQRLLVEGPKGCYEIDHVRDALAAGPARKFQFIYSVSLHGDRNANPSVSGIEPEELPDMPFHQLHDLLLPFRLPVTQVTPHRYGQAELGRHDLRVVLRQHALPDQKPYKPSEIVHDI